VPRSSILQNRTPAWDGSARVGALIAVMAGAAALGYKLGWFDYHHTVEHFRRLRQAHDATLLTFGFIVVFATVTALGGPATLFTVVAGATYGTFIGATLSWLACMLSAVIGYAIARKVGNGAIARWATRSKRARVAANEARNFNGILRLRLLPLFPLSVVNLVAGLARAPWRSYLAASAIGLVPATVIECYFADSLLERVGRGRSSAMASLVVASLLLIGLSLLPQWARMLRARPHSGDGLPNDSHESARQL
jgi:uncharacterized membrane protein YdjX (TVP38/TMEM64 family)